MNQVDSLRFHQRLLRDLFVKFSTIEYQAELGRVNREKADRDFDKPPVDDDDEPIDPADVPTIMFTLPVDRIFEVARQLANVYCVKTGFAEEIPPDDIKDPVLGPFLKATVPPQFALDMQPPDDGDGLNSRSFTAIEGVSLAERIVKGVAGELGFSAEARHASSNANVVREVVVEELKRAGIPVATKERSAPKRKRKERGDES